MSLHSYTRELKSVFVDAAPCDLSRSGHAVYCGPSKASAMFEKSSLFLVLSLSRSNGEVQNSTHAAQGTAALNTRDSGQPLRAAAIVHAISFPAINR
jgi:hypothetical protein